MKKRYLLTAGLLMSCALQAAESDCNPASTRELVRCVLERSPSIRLQGSTVRRDEARADAAGQWNNPELSGQALAGSDSSSGELALEQTFELGGKRRARVEIGRRRAGLSRQELRLVREKDVLATIALLHELRQSRERAELLKETAATYARIIGKMRRYPFLSSEQQVSLALYRASRERMIHKLGQTRGRIDTIQARLKFLSGGATLPEKLPLPAGRRDWPDPPPAPVENQGDGSLMAISRARQDLARARLDLVRAGAWPDLKLGPIVEARRSPGSSGLFGATGSQSETEGGLAFAFQLPLYNLNGPRKELARRDLERARMATSFQKDSLRARRTALVARYRAARAALRATSGPEMNHRRHQRMRAVFLRGLVAPSLVIEFHRELEENLHGYHDSQSAALASLGEIYFLDGRILEEEVYASLL